MELQTDDFQSIAHINLDEKTFSSRVEARFAIQIRV